MKTKSTSSLINDEQSLDSAMNGNYSIPIYDDGYGPLWLSRNSIGINGIVRAKTWEDAYSICQDEFFPEATETIEELIKEYGFRRRHVKIVNDGKGDRQVSDSDYQDGKLIKGIEFIRWDTIETPDADAWSENSLFQENFGMRPNGPNKKDTLNHGIYSKDLNGDYLEELTPSLVERLGITLKLTNNE